MKIMEKEVLNTENVEEKSFEAEKVELIGDTLDTNEGYKKFKFEKSPKYEKFISKLDKFLYSDYYLLVIAAIIFLFWNIGYYARFVEVAGLIIIVLLASFILVVKDDLTLVLPIIFMVAAIFPVEINPMAYGLAVLGLIPLPIALVYHLVHYYRGFKIHKYFFPQLAVSIALIFGGIGTIDAIGYKNGLVWVLLLGIAILALYFLFSNYCKPKKDFDVKKFMAKMFMYTAMLIVLEVIVFYLRDPSRIKDIDERVSLGWCIGNNFASILALLIPGTCYLAVKSKYSWLYTLLLAMQYIAIVLSLSRGGILFALIALPFLLIAMIYYAKAYRKGIVITIVTLIVIFAILIGATWEYSSKLFSTIIHHSFDAEGKVVTNGRNQLYTEAWNCFKSNPIFGVGLGYAGPNYNGGTLGFYFFHSTLFQILACMGLVGIAAYVYNYIVRFRIICKKDVFNVFILLGMITFEAYAMIDTGTFVPMPSMIMVTVTVVMLEIINARGEKEWQFDLNRDGKLISVEKKDEEDVSNVYGRVVEE